MTSRSRQRTNVGTNNRTSRSTSRSSRASARVNMFGGKASRSRKVPAGKLRRAPTPGSVPANYRGRDSIIGDDECARVSEPEVLPTILPREPVRKPQVNYARLGQNPHATPGATDWTVLFDPVDVTVKTQGDLRRKRFQMRMAANNAGVVDVDGDGIIDEVEIKLSRILRHVEGIDYDGDGEVTREETTQTRIERGQEIYAKRFVAENPGIRNFMKEYRYKSDDEIRRAIVEHPDFKTNMHNMIGLGRQYKLASSHHLYAAMAGQITGREQYMQSRVEEATDRRGKLFAQSRSRQAENDARASKAVTFRKKYNGVPSFRSYAHWAQKSRGMARR